MGLRTRLDIKGLVPYAVVMTGSELGRGSLLTAEDIEIDALRFLLLIARVVYPLTTPMGLVRATILEIPALWAVLTTIVTSL